MFVCLFVCERPAGTVKHDNDDLAVFYAIEQFLLDSEIIDQPVLPINTKLKELSATIELNSDAMEYIEENKQLFKSFVNPLSF